MASHPSAATWLGRELVKPVFSVVVPVLSVRNSLETFLAMVEAVDTPKEITLVDDGSTDGTRGIRTLYQDRPGYRMVLQPFNKGKGAALREGVRLATSQIGVIQDAGRTYAEGKNFGRKNRIDALWTRFYFRFLDRAPISRQGLTRLVPANSAEAPAEETAAL